jgi:hypothetical protein
MNRRYNHILINKKRLKIHFKKMRKFAVNYLSTYLLMGEILDHLEHIEPDNEIFFIGF